MKPSQRVVASWLQEIAIDPIPRTRLTCADRPSIAGPMYCGSDDSIVIISRRPSSMRRSGGGSTIWWPLR